MRRVVADYLEPRLCRDAIGVGLTTVPVDDAIAMLRAGRLSSVRYDRGRLVGETSCWGLLCDGELDLVRPWAAAAPNPGAMHRAVLGEAILDDELATLNAGDLADVRLAQHAHGRAISDDDLAAITARATSSMDHWHVGQLRELIAGQRRNALTDEPIQLLEEVTSGEPRIDVWDYPGTGDHAGCLRRLHAAIAHARTQRDPRWPWARLARTCRFLTDDDATAMALLDHARLADVHDDWIEIFGDLGKARIQRAKDVVLAALDRAFDGVPFPGPKQRSLFQAEAADSYRDCDQSRDHTGRWQDLPREHLLACQFALAHLEGESLQYYLPAILSFVVREHDEPRDDHGLRWIFETAEYHLTCSANLRDHTIKRHRCLTPAQYAAVAAFADYYRSEPDDRARWHALGRGEPWPD